MLGKSSLLTLGVALVLLAAGPAAAEHHEMEAAPDLLRFAYWQAGDTAAFEAGVKAHNAFHAEMGDSHTIVTAQVVSGPNTGAYARIVPDMTWADFDQQIEGDLANADETVNPHIASSQVSTWRFRPEISIPGDDASRAVSRVIKFSLKPGSGRSFEAVVAKFHAVLVEQEGWPSYEWWELVDGGSRPTYAVVFARGSWADLGSDPEVGPVLAAKFGPDGVAELAEEFFSHVASEDVETLVMRPDLSYFPAPDDE